MKVTTKQLTEALVDLTKDKEGDELDQVLQYYIEYLAKQGDIYRLQDIVRSIDSVWKERYGVANITIETAHKLTDETKEQLIKLAKGAGVTEKVQPKLIGGARIRIDDRIIDGSILGHLNSLKQTLEAN